MTAKNGREERNTSWGRLANPERGTLESKILKNKKGQRKRKSAGLGHGDRGPVRKIPSITLWVGREVIIMELGERLSRYPGVLISRGK